MGELVPVNRTRLLVLIPFEDSTEPQNALPASDALSYLSVQGSIAISLAHPLSFFTGLETTSDETTNSVS